MCRVLPLFTYNFVKVMVEPYISNLRFKNIRVNYHLPEKFAKMRPQTLAFAVLSLAPHFIGIDGLTVSFTGSGKFTSSQCLQY
jgi:hypothetical protein